MIIAHCPSVVFNFVSLSWEFLQKEGPKGPICYNHLPGLKPDTWLMSSLLAATNRGVYYTGSSMRKHLLKEIKTFSLSWIYFLKKQQREWEWERNKLNCYQNDTWKHFIILLTAKAKLAIDTAMAIVITIKIIP